jgi:hypothetical protein
MVNEIIVAFLGTLLLMNHSESKPVTPSDPPGAGGPPIITRPDARIIPAATPPTDPTVPAGPPRIMPGGPR